MAGTLRRMMLGCALAGLSACTASEFDWDLRGPNSLDTSDAALMATRDRPAPDSRGVLSYPGYQVAVARRGDTVARVAGRLGLDAAALAQRNALQPADPLREGETLVLPSRVAEPPAGSAGSGIPVAATGATAPVEVTTLAGAAISRAESAQGAAPPLPVAVPAGPEPLRHQVRRGETGFGIARAYGVSARALAEWNGLDAAMTLREGQFLLIPTAAPGAAAPPAAAETRVTQPGEGSPTPVPPSAAAPLPEDDTPAAAAATPGTPASPNLGAERTAATSARMAMPVAGSIIRSFDKGRNDGIDIAAPPGTRVVAAADGTVAAVTKDTDQVPILVLRHADNLLTVYAGIDGVTLAKGAAVKRGQQIAVVRRADPAFLHFEVRKGVEAVDPMPYLQ